MALQIVFRAAHARVCVCVCMCVLTTPLCAPAVPTAVPTLAGGEGNYTVKNSSPKQALPEPEPTLTVVVLIMYRTLGGLLPARYQVDRRSVRYILLPFTPTSTSGEGLAGLCSVPSGSCQVCLQWQGFDSWPWCCSVPRFPAPCCSLA